MENIMRNFKPIQQDLQTREKIGGGVGLLIRKGMLDIELIEYSAAE